MKWGYPTAIELNTLSRDLMPAVSEIPSEFWDGRNEFVRDIRRWWCSGVYIDRAIKPGVDPRRAREHIRRCFCSLATPHEHKTAACAYLMSLWFESHKRPPRVDPVDTVDPVDLKADRLRGANDAF